MIHSLNFTGKEFNESDENKTGGGFLGEIGKNVIIICSDLFIKDLIVEKIRCATKKIACNCQIDEGLSLKKHATVYLCDYIDTTVVAVDKMQKFSISVCPEFIYQAKEPNDLWFALYNKKNKIYFYSFEEYKKHADLWRRYRALDKIYQEYRDGIYDGYLGLYESLGVKKEVNHSWKCNL